MQRRRRWVILAAIALATYGLTAWLFLLPPIQLPPSQPLSGRCPAPEQLERLPKQVLYVSLADVPDHLVQALLAQEDEFYHHRGVDWEQTVRAFWGNLWARRYRYGASTLTMQLVRELFLTKDRALLRKLREICYALQAERRLRKDEILEFYLNVVHWGPEIRGVGAASCFYFGVPPARLDEEQSRRLVAILPNPERLGPQLSAWADGQRAAGGALSTGGAAER